MEESLVGLSETFLVAAESAVKSGQLVDRFTHNQTMQGLSLLHAISIVANEVSRQIPEFSL